MSPSRTLDDPRLLDLLSGAELAVEGRIAGASNSTLRCRIDLPGEEPVPCVYKPVAGERPLWDFPAWTLGHRELAAYALSEAAGWHLVPPTAWREDGPGGPGMCQAWIDTDDGEGQVDIVRRGQSPAGWKRVLDAADELGQPVELVHADTPDLRRMAVFDAIANNADRKGGHVLTAADGRTWGIDHGVTFSTEAKLRTVVWGWAGEPLDDQLLDEVRGLHETLGSSFDSVDRWLAEEERDRLRWRVRRMLDTGVFPVPSGRWPAIPWPVF